MTKTTWMAAGVMALAMTLGSGVAEAALTWRRGQLTDRVERGMPTGDAAAAMGRPFASYWMEIGNDSDPTTITLVWRVDGQERTRQTLEVGRAPRWRVWGNARIRGARSIEVTVLDASGATLHTEQFPAQ